MSLVEFKQPEWLDGVTARSIEENMMKNLPLDIDKTEGGIVWDLTMPTALEKAEMIQFYLQNTFQQMFPMWATGRWLDQHAHDAGISRREANKAYGHVTVEGDAGLTIPQGFVFAVPSSDGVPSIGFESLAEATIPSTGSVDIAVQAVEAGTTSNVSNDTVTIMQSPMAGITKITNAEAMTGGTEDESDDDLRERIDEILAGKGDSYTGNNADYVRWAKEVSGVGYAHTIPCYNGPNSVKLVVVDANGVPANEQILQNVFEHIWGADSLEDRKSLDRLAPVGVMDFVVVAPTAVTINYSFKLKLETGATVDEVKSRFKAALSSYYQSVASGDDDMKPVMYIKTYSTLASDVLGVADFEDFRMNGETTNITFHDYEYPVTGTIEVTTYE